MRTRARMLVPVRSATTVALLLLLPACDSAPPAGNRKPQSRPAVPPTQPTTAPTTAPETTPAPPAEPELPEYLEVLARFDGQAPVAVRIEDASGHRLALDTRNVRRLRIERDELPLDRKRSIALILDGQGIEWRVDSDVVEFERSENGRWIPVDPDDETPRRGPSRTRQP